MWFSGPGSLRMCFRSSSVLEDLFFVHSSFLLVIQYFLVLHLLFLQSEHAEIIRCPEFYRFRSRQCSFINKHENNICVDLFCRTDQKT